MGFLAPVVLPAKTILQDLCRLKIGWDDDLPEQAKQRWTDLLSGLHQLEEFKVSRCIKSADFGETVVAQLHHFTDASEDAYGTASYLLLRNQQDQVHCALMIGKARVAPLKRPTIPRMELIAATVATKMDLMLKGELQLKLKPSVFWTDSTAVLKYLRNESTRFRTFVANRVTTILKASKIEQWNHVVTGSNPADCASRGQKVNTFLQNENWISGPKFLYQSTEEWPKSMEEIMISADDPEIKKSVLVNSIQTQHNNSSVRQLMDHFSSWIKLQRIVAWILKFKTMLLELVQRERHLLLQRL